MPTVTLPPGCTGLDMADGTRYTPPRGREHVQIDDAHAHDLRNSQHAANGVVVAGAQFAFGTRTGRTCGPCNRVWNSWSTTCPRCGDITQPEQEHTS